jgi:hypothetical protein
MVFFPHSLICALVFCGAPAQAADHVGNGWIISQTRPTGRCTLFVSPRAIKYGPDARGISYIAKSPDWVLYIYNDRKKTYFALSAVALKSIRKAEPKVPLSMPDGQSSFPKGFIAMLGSQQFTKGNCISIAGLKATVFSSPRGRDISKICVAEDIVVPAQVNALVDYIYDTPSEIHDKNRILLRREVVEKGITHRVFLDTTLARRADLPLSTFEQPGKYRLVESLGEIGSKPY